MYIYIYIYRVVLLELGPSLARSLSLALSRSRALSRSLYRVELLELGVVLEHLETHAVAFPEVAQPLDVVVTVRASRVAQVACFGSSVQVSGLGLGVLGGVRDIVCASVCVCDCVDV